MSPDAYLFLAAFLFTVGAVGVLLQSSRIRFRLQPIDRILQMFLLLFYLHLPLFGIIEISNKQQSQQCKTDDRISIHTYI